MKKIMILWLSFAFLLSGCTIQESAETQTTNQDEVANNGSESILIAYFSWADNTIVDDEEASIESALRHYESVGDSNNEDAVSSASILVPGNVAKMAEWIQQETKADLFSIQVEDPYPSNYDDCLDRAADEKAEDARPNLKSRVENIDEYDTVFIGYPNWWYSVPMPVLTFIEENDLSNKKIVLFCSHGTGGLSRSVEDIQAVLPDSASLEENVIGIYRSEINDSQEEVIQWLHDIGYERNE